jgi:hypothetical protein
MLAVGIYDITQREIPLFIVDLSLAQDMKAFRGDIDPFIFKQDI